MKFILDCISLGFRNYLGNESILYVCKLRVLIFHNIISVVNFFFQLPSVVKKYT